MTRVKRGKTSSARRKRLLKNAKGFMWTRSTKYRQAKEALLHAWTHQFADRKKKKRNFRRLWNTRIGAAAKTAGTSYSKLIAQLKAAGKEFEYKIYEDAPGGHSFNRTDTVLAGQGAAERPGDRVDPPSPPAPDTPRDPAPPEKGPPPSRPAARGASAADMGRSGVRLGGAGAARGPCASRAATSLLPIGSLPCNPGFPATTGIVAGGWNSCLPSAIESPHHDPVWKHRAPVHVQLVPGAVGRRLARGFQDGR